jgi:integrase
MKKIDGQDRRRVRVTYHGKQVSRLLPAGTTAGGARMAEDLLLEELRAVAGQATQSIIGAPSLDHVLDAYITDLQQRGKSNDAVRHVKASKGHLGEFLGGRMLRPAGDLTADTLFDFRTFALDKGLHPNTVNNIFSVLRAALHVACPSIELPKSLFLRVGQQPRPLDPDECQEVIAHLSPPNHVIAELSGLTVMRLREIVGLRRTQVELSAGVVYLEGRVVVLGVRARQILEEQLRSHDSEWVFPALHGGKPLSSASVTRRWAQAARSAELPHYPFHFLRHLAVTLAYSTGVSAQSLMSLGGWKSLQPFERLRIVDGTTLREAAEAIAKAMKPVFTKKRTKKSGKKE